MYRWVEDIQVCRKQKQQKHAGEIKIARVGIWKCTGAAENLQAGRDKPFQVRVSYFKVISWISSTGGHFWWD
ncbi:hypothetical protein PAXRUDRAFT_836224 [Paxillus rubicundulus Ve08.2h10]|uniref:Uncharacterized protein n=1 Tax=Paxillus rubicundulus Ve08.2h10 TaxID=930991 RepID=A0A0D0D186_9AGAM|nr:hypothetical protein PAXRUDRAFT_836224 [Paxillus rubicundulus Ve08.2h10]